MYGSFPKRVDDILSGGTMKNILILSLVAVAVGANAQNLYSNQSSNVNIAALNAQRLTKSNVAEAGGGYWSEVQNNTGNTTESNTTAGFSMPVVSGGGFRVADNFTFNVGQYWNVNKVKVYAYATGAGVFAPGALNSMKIWSGRPGDGGSTALWDSGNTTVTTNALINTADGNKALYRIFNTVAPPPGTAPGTTRRIVEFEFAVPTLTLIGGGNYWVDYTIDRGGLAVFGPSTTHEGARGVSGANGRQLNVATNTWSDLIDTGNPAAAPDVAQDMPFIVAGTAQVPEPATMAALGLGVAALLRRRRQSK
jgi:hypothetical protein